MEKLFTPFRVGNLQVKNRIAMPPMGTGLGNDDGTPSDILIHYYGRRSRGGVGLIIVELAAVDPLGRSGTRNLSIFDSRGIDSYKKLVHEVKKYGARAAIQLNHAGRLAKPDVIKAKPICPSPSPLTPKSEIPREMGKDEIKSLVEAYVHAASRAKKAGFDAVELHGAHGYLIWQFLSPLCNRRQDEYGGSTEGRARFAEEIVWGIKQELGREFPLIFRLSGSDFLEGGLSLKETKSIARILEKAGVDLLHVSGGNFAAPHWMIQPMTMPRGCLAHLAEAIRKEIHIPVITVGRINDPQIAESILQEGKADLVAIGRGLIADPDFPKKAMDGNILEIRKCVADNMCIHLRFRGYPIDCMVNPEVGREKDFMAPSKRVRKILVVGGGPAGLEASRVARLRGHDVTLWEKRDHLGGQLPLASKAPYKGEIGNILSYYLGQIEKLGVKVTLNKDASQAEIKGFGADAVVLASGSSPFLPKIQGIEQSNVFQARDVLEENAKVSGKVVIIGGGHVGCETAEFLHKQGASVTILEMLGDILLDMEPIGGSVVKKVIAEHGIRVVLGAQASRIAKNRLFYCDQNAKEYFLEGDFFVVAAGAFSDSSLLKSLEKESFDLYPVGDCVKPGDLFNAIHDGASAGIRL